MGTQSFFADDAVTALELVERTFGSDALILSVDWTDDRVEVRATDASAAGGRQAGEAAPFRKTGHAPRRPGFLEPGRPSPFDRALGADPAQGQDRPDRPPAPAPTGARFFRSSLAQPDLTAKPHFRSARDRFARRQGAQ